MGKFTSKMEESTENTYNNLESIPNKMNHYNLQHKTQMLEH